MNGKWLENPEKWWKSGKVVKNKNQEHYYQAINTKILVSRFDLESKIKNKDQEPALRAQGAQASRNSHK